MNEQQEWKPRAEKLHLLNPSVHWILVIIFGLLLLLTLWQTAWVQRWLARTITEQQATRFAEVATDLYVNDGRRIAIQDGTLNYYSADQLPTDAFGQRAYQALLADPTLPLFEVIRTDEGSVLRYARAAGDSVVDIGLPIDIASVQRASLATVVQLLILSAIFVVSVWRANSVERSLERRQIESSRELAAAQRQSAAAVSRAQAVDSMLTAVVNVATDGMVTVDSRNRIVRVNSRAAKMWGYSMAELESMNLAKLVNGRMQPLEYFNLQRVGGDNVAPVLKQCVQMTAVRKDGSTFPIEMRVAQAEIDDQLLYVIMAQDVSERSRLEEALKNERAQFMRHVEERTAEQRQTYEELLRVSKRKDEFLAAMSHELRTPLNAILGLSDALLSATYGDLGSRPQRPLRMIQQSGKHLLDLINDILDVSKIEAGNVELDVVPVGVRSISEASLHLVRPVAEQKGIQLSLQIEPNIDIVDADQRRLKQILVNLLSNAVKFTEPGGRVGLQIATDEGRKHVLFSVVDTGSGIAAEHLDDLFEPFVQFQAPVGADAKGSGLGLTLVHRLTELHGGHIELESEVGRGSCFTVYLPWEQQAQPRIEPADSSDELPLPTISNNGDDEPLILMVEDNEINIATLYDFLDFKGYRINIARDGVEALEQANRERPDLILMDIQMPNMDGLEATRRLRANPETASIPIIALTGLAMSGDRERCLEAGTDDYLSKPFDIEVLVNKMQKLLQRAAAVV